MKTDPPATNSASEPPKPQPPRPRGKVFDVMRPGKAPASPTSRPVVIGHKPQAQHAQVTVSGIGAAPPREALAAHKPVPIQVGNTGDSLAAPLAEPAKTEDALVVPQPAAAHVPETAIVPDTPAPAATPEIAAEQKSEPALVEPALQPAELPAAPAGPDKLAAVAMEPDAPAPTPEEISPPKLPIPEVADDDPVHDVAEPSLKGQVVVSHHSAATEGPGKLIALVVLTVIFLALVLDVLLDAGVISTSVIPHTHFF